ncbi:hypothetical protein K440DRAFT_617754 [Wilcoxina mikolae CBS 423.85]|nr:hypothetical protein K440DRAFT_617754 [Wilcoxina mikolae CBS 423.85]
MKLPRKTENSSGSPACLSPFRLGLWILSFSGIPRIHPESSLTNHEGLFASLIDTPETSPQPHPTSHIPHYVYLTCCNRAKSYQLRSHSNPLTPPSYSHSALQFIPNYLLAVPSQPLEELHSTVLAECLMRTWSTIHLSLPVSCKCKAIDI